MANKKSQTFQSVWTALSDSPEEAANLRARSDLMMTIATLIQEAKWTQSEAAERCGVSQPRISDLLRGHVSKFSLDALVNIAASLHKRVTMTLEDCDDEIAHA